MFLTKDEVVDLTGHARPAIQSRWLRTNAIPFILGGDGYPKVPKQSLLDKIDCNNSRDEKTESQICGLIDITENWDKVSESMMAELLGTTARALQGKRARGITPENVWSKVDGSIMYSLKRYEAFLDTQWPAHIPIAPAPPKPAATNLRRKKNTNQRTPVTLLV
ncbi:MULTISPECIES: DUF4224 domain-containing protein [unclassified Pseudomonas]|uniref:DUF4224 domain-containing protein n=1 Tax=unclassified Pseudomonas TaxID=196821 RepID=UPI001304E86E|nr:MULTISPECIES: DUF4224 domain-containing protein [unclassified Pseudomonas]